MSVPALLYHDVIPANCLGDSGFSGADADVYKLTPEAFAEHLQAIRTRTGGRAVRVFDVLQELTNANDFMLTFDDGGSGATRYTVPMLSEYKWFGHFFISTDFIGKPGFLTADEIRQLSRLGHVIGSHSCSHPPMISRCTRQELLREWRESVALLSDITGVPVTSGSIPAGFLSNAVADAAAEAGIKALFTSEPKTSVTGRNGCVLLGRYSIQQATPPAQAGELAANQIWATRRQWLLWNAKKPLKRFGGRYWLAFRQHVFSRRTEARQ
jgi:peptidoglycan/xylan/chitin deacetylase (PgdA/CDA1 family)